MAVVYGCKPDGVCGAHCRMACCMTFLACHKHVSCCMLQAMLQATWHVACCTPRGMLYVARRADVSYPLFRQGAPVLEDTKSYRAGCCAVQTLGRARSVPCRVGYAQVLAGANDGKMRLLETPLAEMLADEIAEHLATRDSFPAFSAAVTLKLSAAHP